MLDNTVPSFWVVMANTLVLILSISLLAYLFVFIPSACAEVMQVSGGKTELQGFTAASFMDPPEIRKRTERDLKFPDADIPYYKAEAALRDLVCSLMERDDRMNEDMFLRWNGLKHRIEDLEDEIQALKSRGTTKDQEVPG